MKTPMFLCALAVAAGPALAQPEPALSALPLPELQRLYLHCEREAATRLLDFGTATFCSTAAETLRLRGFDGSFERMLAWWRSARAAADGTALSAQR
jgi:hypothetical protein